MNQDLPKMQRQQRLESILYVFCSKVNYLIISIMVRVHILEIYYMSYTKYITCISSVKSHNSKWNRYITPFYRWGIWGLEKLNNFQSHLPIRSGTVFELQQAASSVRVPNLTRQCMIKWGKVRESATPWMMPRFFK